MDRLTETKFEREIRVSFAIMDRHIQDGIDRLDELKKEYEQNPAIATIHAPDYPSVFQAIMALQSQYFNPYLNIGTLQADMYRNSYGQASFSNSLLAQCLQSVRY